MGPSRDDNRKEVINQNCQHSAAAAAERRNGASDAYQSTRSTSSHGTEIFSTALHSSGFGPSKSKAAGFPLKPSGNYNVPPALRISNCAFCIYVFRMIRSVTAIIFLNINSQLIFGEVLCFLCGTD
jgi:hypothetical protein